MKNQNVKKLLLVILAIFAAFLVCVAILFCVGVVKGFREAARRGGSPAAIERRLGETAKQMNAGLPRMEGDGVRLDSIAAGPGTRLTYTCTLVNVSTADLDSAKFASTAKLKILDGYKTNPRMAPLRKMEVELAYKYLDKDGKDIATIVASPKEF